MKIKIAFAGICGSDLGIHQAGPPEPLEHPLVGEPAPHVLGHELSGWVTDVADGIESVVVGDLVTVRPTRVCGECATCRSGRRNLCPHWAGLGIHGGGGGFSEYVVVSSDQVFVLPKSVTPEAAALVEPLSVAWHAVSVSGATQDSTAVVVGAGPIGLGLVLALRAKKARRIIVAEPSPRRRELAASFGAEVIDPTTSDVPEVVSARTAGTGADVSFDGSGAGNATFETTLAALRAGGTAVVVALYHSPIIWDPGMILFTEKRIVGSFGYWDDDYTDVINAIASGAIDPTPLVTSIIALDDIVGKGIAHLAQGPGRETEIKILVAP